MLDAAANPLSIAFFIALDEQGELLRHSGPFGVAEGRVAFGSGSLLLEEDEHAAVVIAFDEARLLDLVPGYDHARKIELALERNTDLSFQRSTLIKDPVHTRLPRRSDLFRINVDAGALEPAERDDYPHLEELLLSVPSNPEFCTAGDTRTIRPFAVRTEFLRDSPLLDVIDPERDNTNRIEHLLPLDEDHLIADASSVLFIADRSGVVHPIEPAPPFRTLIPERLSPPLGGIRGVAMDPRPFPDGRRRIWIAGTYSGRGRLWELAVSAEGFVPIASATIAAGVGPLPEMSELGIDENGAIIAVGYQGTVLVRGAGETEFRRALYPQPENMVRFAITGIREHPHLIGLKGSRIVSGDALLARWNDPVLLAENELIGMDDDVISVTASPEGDEMWAATEGSVVSRWTNRTGWLAIDSELPPSFAPCTEGRRLLRFDTRMPGIFVDAESAYVVSQRCNALLRIDRRTSCIGPIPPDGAEIARISDERGAIAASDQHIYLGGDYGAIFELDR